MGETPQGEGELESSRDGSTQTQPCSSILLPQMEPWAHTHGRIAAQSGGFIPAETLVQNGTAGDTGSAGVTLNQPVPGFLVG